MAGKQRLFSSGVRSCGGPSQGLMWRADVVSPKASQEQSAKVAAVSLALESALLY